MMPQIVRAWEVRAGDVLVAPQGVRILDVEHNAVNRTVRLVRTDHVTSWYQEQDNLLLAARPAF